MGRPYFNFHHVIWQEFSQTARKSQPMKSVSSECSFPAPRIRHREENQPFACQALLSSSYHQKQAQTRGESTSWYIKRLSLLFVLYVLISQFAINHHPGNQTLSYLYILFENTFQFPFTWTALSFATPAECINLHSTLWIYLRSLMTHTRQREHNHYRGNTRLKSVMQLHTEGCVIISK